MKIINLILIKTIILIITIIIITSSPESAQHPRDQQVELAEGDQDAHHPLFMLLLVLVLLLLLLLLLLLSQ